MMDFTEAQIKFAHYLQGVDPDLGQQTQTSEDTSNLHGNVICVIRLF